MAVLHSFIGSPSSVMMLEEMVASGAKQVVEVGLCGGLVEPTAVGDVVLVDRAFADEGTSGHYFHSAGEFSASPRLGKRVERALKRAQTPYLTGSVWTTDAPYRETRRKAAAFGDKGAVGVNMESSALFALCEYRGVQIASLQVVSDLLWGKRWRPSFHKSKVTSSSRLAVAAAVEALVGPPA